MAVLPDFYNTQFNQAVSDVASIQLIALADARRYRQLTNLAQAGLTDPADVTVRVDVYDGPLGVGYVVIGRATVNAVTYLRAQNVGPETDRTHDWTEIGQENF
jgi:hypothetical protein